MFCKLKVLWWDGGKAFVAFCLNICPHVAIYGVAGPSTRSWRQGMTRVPERRNQRPRQTNVCSTNIYYCSVHSTLLLLTNVFFLCSSQRTCWIWLRASQSDVVERGTPVTTQVRPFSRQLFFFFMSVLVLQTFICCFLKQANNFWKPWFLKAPCVTFRDLLA